MTEDTVSSALRDLRVSAKELNALGDTVNSTFKKVEAAVVETGVGLAMSIDIGEYDGTSYKLGFQKYGGNWRIVVGAPAIDDFDNYYTKYAPWENAPRDVKLYAVNYLPRLITTLHTQAKQRIDQTKSTVATIARSLAGTDGK